MAADVVVSVRGVGKVYRLYDRPQDRLKHMLFSRVGQSYGHEFWALSGVSFDVRRGEVVGIIGRNGSGKSTLLQIIAGILQPAAGEVRLEGRVAALLELGSGFNPDATGLENVRMNAAILGVARATIERRLDEIAAFADIGEFIDQPVKTYSSGMFVRLAFAVTTSLDADVLLVDEALAVGDVFFRQRCYQRLADLRARGVAIVLVSHALNEVEQFCERALLLDAGRVRFEGSAIEAVKRYYLLGDAGGAAGAARAPADARAVGLVDSGSPTSRPGAGAEPNASHGDGFAWPEPEAFLDLSPVAQVSGGRASCTAVALCDAEGRPRRVFTQGETASFLYEFELADDIEVPTGGVELVNDKGIIVHGKATLEYGSDVPREVGRGCRIRFRQDIALDLAVGDYTLNIGLGTLRRDVFDRRAQMAHGELDARLERLCLLPGAGSFAVVLRPVGPPVQLVHHGVANLPGSCRVAVVPPPGAARAERAAGQDGGRAARVTVTAR